MKVAHDSKEWGIDLTECILRIKNEKAKPYLKLLSDFILEREKFKNSQSIHAIFKHINQNIVYESF
ncbi:MULTISPECIES: hypothetical protein [Leptospira]|uniref:Uncharacterized protein n=1 Tax=Leptospira weilii str. Ecochallenge TaxID=1049986 RepID=N1U5L3_9LEPT|nr:MULTISPECIES: hypothetical protein [Leptospira]EMY13199.1 hypothetical protein LEP1GSC043_2908 [Leptospira weilii str. Ecochallenge]MCL8267582.1 hypothetical protein [Leptospira weilii]MDL5244743.1 hypothetical protein [Leptospira weilii]QDK23171.1 hypothetical protein FHG67_10935 [Leptospira weilii]ULH27302.1 hypothetical protein FH586_12755 [Leptospira weilii]